MKVIAVKLQTNPKDGSVLYRIELSDGSLLSVSNSYISIAYQQQFLAFLNKEAALDTQWELSGDEEAAFQFSAACFKTERAALRLIARAEQTSFGLSNKLIRRGHSVEAVQAVVSHLMDLEIVDDTRYALLWLQARMARKLESPRYLIAALCKRGIKRNIAVAALKSILNTENESVLLRKYMKYKGFTIETSLINPKMYDKHSADTHKNSFLLKQQLKYEGFSSSAIELLWEEEGL
jgi:regulatory protein